MIAIHMIALTFCTFKHYFGPVCIVRKQDWTPKSTFTGKFVQVYRSSITPLFFYWNTNICVCVTFSLQPFSLLVYFFFHSFAVNWSRRLSYLLFIGWANQSEDQKYISHLSWLAKCFMNIQWSWSASWSLEFHCIKGTGHYW